MCPLCQVGFINSLKFSSAGDFLVAGVGQEHRYIHGGRWSWGRGGAGQMGIGEDGVGLPQLVLSFPSGLADGGGSKRLGTQSASSHSAEPLRPLLLGPDTHPYLSTFQHPPPFVLKPSVLDLVLLAWGWVGVAETRSWPLVFFRGLWEGTSAGSCMTSSASCSPRLGADGSASAHPSAKKLWLSVLCKGSSWGLRVKWNSKTYKSG